MKKGLAWQATNIVKACAGLVLVGLLASCAVLSPAPVAPVLAGLESRCEELSVVLSVDTTSAQCDGSWLDIEKDGVTYAVSDDGIRWMDFGIVRIALSDTDRDGRVVGITVWVGNGLDAAKAVYRMDDLSNPRAGYLGDDIKVVQQAIEAEISTEEMKQYVAQAEQYQKVIKAELLKLQQNERG